MPLKGRSANAPPIGSNLTGYTVLDRDLRTVLKTPYYEGTGALYFRLSKVDDHVVLLTAAHVARPPPAYATNGISHDHASQPREEITALSNMGYESAMGTMMVAIRVLARSVAVWKDVITRLGEFVDREGTAATEKRGCGRCYTSISSPPAMPISRFEQVHLENHLNKLHDEVTKRRTNPDQRIINNADDDAVIAAAKIEKLTLPSLQQRTKRQFQLLADDYKIINLPKLAIARKETLKEQRLIERDAGMSESVRFEALNKLNAYHRNSMTGSHRFQPWIC